MFLDAFKGDSRELQGYLKEVKRVFQWSFKWVFDESCKGVSRKIEWGSLGPSMVIQGSFKGI